VVQTHVQGDAVLQDAGPGRVLAGQGEGYFLGDEADLTVVSDQPALSGNSNQTSRSPLQIAAGDPMSGITL